MTNAMEEHLWFDAGEDRCEGILSYPGEGAAHAAMLLLAPHPHFGGNMDNNVLRHIASAAAGDGVMTLRFNYRGIGKSILANGHCASVYDYYQNVEATRAYETFMPECAAAWDVLAAAWDVLAATGEALAATGEALAAAGEALAARPGLGSNMVFGYSLGALLAARLSAVRRTGHIFALSPPNRRSGLYEYMDCTVPTTFFGGDNDFAFDRAGLEEDRAKIPAPTEFIEISGADHFFRQDEHRIYQALCESPFYATRESRQHHDDTAKRPCDTPPSPCTIPPARGLQRPYPTSQPRPQVTR